MTKIVVDFNEFLRDVKVGFAEELAELIREKIKESGAVASGRLLESVRTEHSSESDEVLVVVDAPYASYVEFGTRPHFPPVEPLIEWAMRKFGLNEREARKVAWAVANEIAKKGTEPKAFVRKAIFELKKRYEQ